MIVADGATSFSRMKVGPNSLLKHVAIGFDNVFGRNLQAEAPDLFEFVQSCWIARGNVAHGKPGKWTFKGVTSDWFSGDVGWATVQFIKVKDWFRELHATLVPDARL
jgi:hypothetical protein